jgi:ribonuclease HI
MVEVYTDGSYNISRFLGAYAFIVVEDEKIIYKNSATLYNPKSWNIDGELEAILEGLKWSIKNGFKDIVVYSDLQIASSIFKTNKRTQGSAITKKYKEQVEFMKGLANISVVWIKGHNGNKYNELANTMAEMLTR